MCKAIREGDEMACSCGLRWDVDEADPHNEVTHYCNGEPCIDEGCTAMEERSVVNGHVLYRDSDFNRETEFTTLGIAVIDGGLQVCKICGEYESGLSNPCKGEA